MHIVHVALQQFQIVTIMLCRLALYFSGKVAVLHLDNSTENAFIRNHGGAVSFFF